jgi:hypothetical protein
MANDRTGADDSDDDGQTTAGTPQLLATQTRTEQRERAAGVASDAAEYAEGAQTRAVPSRKHAEDARTRLASLGNGRTSTT